MSRGRARGQVERGPDKFQKGKPCCVVCGVGSACKLARFVYLLWNIVCDCVCLRVMVLCVPVALGLVSVCCANQPHTVFAVIKEILVFFLQWLNMQHCFLHTTELKAGAGR